ncbi:MAG: radical SAM peptide maturase, CXXX-repeat target family [Thermoguttaceae bacterium]|nr:radical SAM peptide maturase, CXXX-repeat target family [Thermoguttaceae bacterium]MBQ6614934.1 radical SAM peptide maturase, CXXX-repeat target family [Thermoguttaceae bacterium]
MDLSKQITYWESGTARNITFIVTEDCQLRCKYCYICGKNSFKKMSFDVAKKSIDYILTHRDLFSEKAVTWDFIGGEPLLEIKLIDKICDYIKTRAEELNHPWSKKYVFNFSTNGLLYDHPDVQAFFEKNQEHINVGISVDGTKEKHDLQRVFPNQMGSYDAIKSKVDLWIKQVGRPITKSTVAHDDLSMIKDSVLHLWDLGIPDIAMNCVFEDVWQPGDDKILEDQLKQLADVIIEKKLYEKHRCTFFDRTIGFPMDPVTDNNNWCGAGRMLAIDTEGKFHPCIRFAKFSLDNRPEIITGNCNDGLDTNRTRPYLALNRTVQSSPECVNCEVASGCAWCQGSNYDEADSDTIYQRATSICAMHKARVRANNYLWNKLDKIVPPAADDSRLVKLSTRKGLQSLIVILDSSAPSFCYYHEERETITNQKSAKQKEERVLMSPQLLSRIAEYALDYNLTLNLVVGKEGLSNEHKEILKWNSYIVIAPYNSQNSSNQTADITVFDFESDNWIKGKRFNSIILRIFSWNLPMLSKWLDENSMDFNRLSLIIKNLDTVSDRKLENYQTVLKKISGWLPEREERQPLELSFLTDRLILNEPHDCDAGVKHFTIAPDGMVYLCPGFYKTNTPEAIKSFDDFIVDRTFPNERLLKRENAPICEKCDAWHCHRCVWLNKKTTGELNTPSEQQCIEAHRERNASRNLIEPLFLTDDVTIPEIDYLDPFTLLTKNHKQPNQDNC